MGTVIDLVGQKYGMFEVLSFERVYKRDSYWRVRCECGTEQVRTSRALRNGSVWSCGCRRRFIDDITGRTFGDWTVLRFDRTHKGMAYFIVQCVCGTTKSLPGKALKAGKTKSCGCRATRNAKPKKPKREGPHNDGKTLAVHDYVCGQCGLAFKSDSRGKATAISAGRLVFCSEACARLRSNEQQNLRPGRHLCGPCRTCGKMFRSKSKGRIFCSLPCYIGSEELLTRLRQNNESKKKPRICLNCGGDTKKARKFCGDRCRRAWFAERFDRFIANPETVALPQGYDEFLSQTMLPCIIGDCDWTGERLALHCNLVHGVTAKQLKELAGFNRTTALATMRVREQQSRIATALQAAGLTGLSFPAGKYTGPTHKPTPRLESIEHSRKSASVLANSPSGKVRPCDECGADVLQNVIGWKKYCNLLCRAKNYAKRGWAELNCSHCGKAFMANRVQVLRAQRELPVCCSLDCRNHHNMAICLTRRASRKRDK